MNDGHLPHDADALLQQSRRLDWRFLLPECTLARVGYHGPPDAPLLESLQIFSREVVVLDARAFVTRPDAPYDLLVLQSPQPTTLLEARALLAPGGAIYAEVRRLVARNGPATARTPASFAAAARRGGLVDVALHWHWPDFETCTRMIPLDQPAPLGFVLARGRSGPVAHLQSFAARALVGSGIIGWTVPCFSLVARRPDGPPPRAGGDAAST